MDTSFHYLLMANQALIHKGLLSSLKDTGLSLGQPKILDYLKDHDGSNQKEIAQGCHIEAASLTSVLGRMEERGMIERKMLNGNRRSLYVFLTEKGKKMQTAVERGFSSLEEKAFAGISEEEQKLFMDTFLKIYENLKRDL